MQTPADHTAAIAALGVHFERAAARELLEVKAHKAEALRQSRSGFAVDLAPRRAKTVEDLIAEATVEANRANADAASPEGRFKRAARIIMAATGDERLMNCASRGIAGNADHAAKLLAGMEGPVAEEARAALVSLVVGQERKAA